MKKSRLIYISLIISACSGSYSNSAIHKPEDNGKKEIAKDTVKLPILPITDKMICAATNIDDVANNWKMNKCQLLYLFQEDCFETIHLTGDYRKIRLFIHEEGNRPTNIYLFESNSQCIVLTQKTFPTNLFSFYYYLTQNSEIEYRTIRKIVPFNNIQDIIGSIEKAFSIEENNSERHNITYQIEVLQPNYYVYNAYDKLTSKQEEIINYLKNFSKN